jgi:YD repeat-containing protein
MNLLAPALLVPPRKHLFADQRGRRTKRTLPLGQTESNAYDNNGNLASRTDFNGRTTTYSYDNMNRLLTKTADAYFAQNHIGAAAVAYTYNSQGRASMTDANGTTTYTYSGVQLRGVMNPAGTLIYNYDTAHRLASVSGPRQVNYVYDALNRLSTVQESSTGTTTYTYENVGNLASVTYPNGVVHAYGYDQRNRLTNLGVNKTSTPIASYGYTLDAAGHRTDVTELSGRVVSYAFSSVGSSRQFLSPTLLGNTVCTKKREDSWDGIGT